MRIRGAPFGLTLLLACSDPTAPPANPVPVLTSMTPAIIVVGSEPTTIILTGRDFVDGAHILADGRELPSSLSGTTSVSAQLEASELTTPRIITFAVANPAPGGGVSGTLLLVVTQPAPAIASVTPAQLFAGDTAVTLRIVGERFHPSAVVTWNGNSRPTRVISTTEMEADLSAADLLVAMRAKLGVVNPELEGGTGEIEVFVYNRQPILTAIAPGRRLLGNTSFTMTVTGDGFLPGAVVTWNGEARPTTYLSSSVLTAAIPASDLEAAGPAAVAVENSEPAVAASGAMPFLVDPPVLVDLLAWDLAWDSVRGRLYASVATDDPRFPGEVVAIDPATGNVVARITPGAAPTRLAISDDASKLYVGLDDEPAVARIDLATFTRDLHFLLGTGDLGALYAQDIEVMPGAPGTVAISRMHRDFTPYHDSVAIYDDGVMRPGITAGGNLIEFASPTTLYGYNNETTGHQLYRLEVSNTGVTLHSQTEGIVEGFNNDIRYGSGYVFSMGENYSPSRVVDAETGLLTASFDGIGLPCPEPAGGRVYYKNGPTLYAYSTETWSLIGTEPVPPGAPLAFTPSLTRWGTHGLAYVAANHVVVYRSDLVAQ